MQSPYEVILKLDFYLLCIIDVFLQHISPVVKLYPNID